MNFFMSGELGGGNSGKTIDLIKEIEKNKTIRYKRLWW